MRKMILHNNESVENSTIVARLPLPTFGYTVRLVKAMAIRRFADDIQAFDRGIENDHYTVDFTLNLTQTDTQFASIFFKEIRTRGNIDDKGQKIFYLTLDGGSFFPAGPYYGDLGTYTVSEQQGRAFSAMQVEENFGLFMFNVRLLLRGLPNPLPYYAPRDTESVYKFGSVDGLTDPIISTKQEYGEINNLSLGGYHSFVNSEIPEYTSDIVQRASINKMKELQSYVQRYWNDIIVIDAKKNYWLFGPDNQESGLIHVKLMNNNYIFVHENVDLWNVKLELFRYRIAI